MRSYARYAHARGGVLLMTLVILGVFVVIMMGVVALVNRQFKQVVVQEQEEQAFQVAEAGIDYALWLLDTGLVDYQGPLAIEDYAVTDHTQDPPEVIGNFDVMFDVITYDVAAPSVALRVTSIGQDAVLMDQTQTIEATVHSVDLDDFRVVEWDHKP